MNKILYQGIYAPYIKDLISFKKSLGFKYEEEGKILARFDRFTIEQNAKQVGITKELFDKWCNRKGEESDLYRYNRCVCVNQLSSYLCDIGIISYISKLPKRRYSFVPYIFSKKEIEILFETSNRLETKTKKMNSVLFSIPILIRLLYSTGLRITEALFLNNRAVNLSDNILIVKDSKNGKERMIPLSDTLSEACREYQRYRNKLPITISEDSPFFVSLNGKRYTQSEAYHWFRELLRESKISFTGNEHKHRGPRLHDLRHTAACHALAQMVENGMDLYCALPILSSFLGHQTLKATDLYVRLTAEMYPNLIKNINMECLNVFPNIDEYETN